MVELPENMRVYYQDILENIRFYKMQQWRTTYYALAAYAAIYFLGHNDSALPLLEFSVLSALALFVLAYGAFSVCAHEFQLSDSRKNLLTVYRLYFSYRDRKKFKLAGKRRNPKRDFFLFSMFPITIFIAFLIVVVSLWQATPSLKCVNLDGLRFHSVLGISPSKSL